MLKLYVWENVLHDWGAGMAFALAESPERAAEFLKKQISYASWDGVKLDGVEPREVTAAEAFYVWGSS